MKKRSGRVMLSAAKHDMPTMVALVLYGATAHFVADDALNKQVHLAQKRFLRGKIVNHPHVSLVNSVYRSEHRSGSGDIIAGVETFHRLARDETVSFIDRVLRAVFNTLHTLIQRGAEKEKIALFQKIFPELLQSGSILAACKLNYHQPCSAQHLRQREIHAVTQDR